MSYLEDKMRDLLAEASVVAEAKASAMSQPTSHGKPGSAILASEGPSLYDRLERRFMACATDAEKQAAVDWATDEVKKAKRQEPKELTSRQKEYWVLVDSQGKDYRDVAASEGLREETVWRMRVEAGYEPRRGRPKAA